MYAKKVITSQVDIVDKHSNISNDLKNNIKEKLKEIKSYTQISIEEKVSINTVSDC